MSRPGTNIVLIPIGPALLSGPSGGPRTIYASGTWTHPPSGFRLPTAFGVFERGTIAQYDTAGNDIGVGYRVKRRGLTNTWPSWTSRSRAP